MENSHFAQFFADSKLLTKKALKDGGRFGVITRHEERIIVRIS